MQRNTFFSLRSAFRFGACCAGVCLLAGCSATVPKLAPMKAETPVRTTYTNALNDLNTVLETYLPTDYPVTYFAVKPVTDATGLSATGEIPVDITSLVRDAISQVHYKVRHLERKDTSDQIQLQVELLELQMKKLQGISVKQAERPANDFTIEGRISQFDRNLESTSDKARAMLAFGGGSGRTDINASAEKSSRLSRLAVSFNVYKPDGVSLPGKFGAGMEVQYAKNGFDIGFAIYGNGLGYGSEATAMHGRHLALQMMAEFSVVQIIGRALNVPYWRVGAANKIFTPDEIVLKDWRESYQNMGEAKLVAYMQSQCIANGDASVAVNGRLDEATRAAFDRYAAKYGVSNRSYPNFELFRALEENRILSAGTARNAWAAYSAYKGGARPAPAVAKPAPASAAPAAAPDQPKKPAVTPAVAPVSKPSRPRQAAASVAPTRRPASGGTPKPAARPAGPAASSNPLQGLID